MCRITPKTLANAIHELSRMSVGDQQLLADEIYRAQPNLLASVLALSSFDVHVSRIEFALRSLLLIFLAQKRNGNEVVTHGRSSRRITRLNVSRN